MKKNNCFQTILPVACKLLLLILIFQTLVFTQESDELCSLSQLLEGIEGGREVQRPFYSNEISDVYNDHFVIHYTTDGSCMTFNGDPLEDPVLEPDCAITTELAQETLIHAENAYQLYQSLGWIMPAPDDIPVGDDRIDIYFTNVPNGVAAPESDYPDPYLTGMTGFIEIAFNISTLNLLGLTGSDLLEMIVSHELHHAIQFRYHEPIGSIFLGYDQNNFWAYESSSTFLEDIVNDDLNSLYYRLANYTITPLNSSFKNLQNFDMRYTSALWWVFISEFYDDENILKMSWEWWGNNPLEYYLEASEYVVVDLLESNMDIAFENYAIWRYFTGDRSDPLLYFSEGDFYPTSTLLQSHNSYPANGDNGSDYISNNGGTSFVEFNNPSQIIDLPILFDGTDDAYGYPCDWSVDFICFSDGNDPAFWEMELNQYNQGDLDILNQCDKVTMLSTSRAVSPFGGGFCSYAYNADDSYERSINFFNIVGLTDNVGELTIDDSQTVQSGSSIPLLFDSDHEVKTDDGFFEDFQGSGDFYRHHNWNDSEIWDNHYLNEYFHVNFEIGNMNANYSKQNSIYINSNVEDIEISILDPWWVELAGENIGEQLDRFHELTEDPEFNISTGEYMVFLNQNETYNEELPVYSLSVPQLYISGNEAYIYSGWVASDIGANGADADFSDPTNITDVVFKTEGATVTAIYNDVVFDDPVGASAAPANLSVDGSSGSPILTWDHVNDADRSHYNIWVRYYNPSKCPCLWHKIATTSNNQWTDNNVNTGGISPDRIYYKVTVEDYFSNISNYSNSVWIRGDVLMWPLFRGAELAAEIPNEYNFHNSYPNPFNPLTTLRYDLPENGNVSLVVYDVNGKELVQLVNTYMDAGYHSIQWDATNFASGVYMVKLVAGDFTQTQKIALVK